MANKYMNNLTNIGTKVAFAAAMTAALAMPASADEIEEIPAPQSEAPVVADPAPVETSSDVQEVSGHNQAVSESNSAAAAENTATGANNESTGSDNQSVAGSNEAVFSGSDSSAGNETVTESNASTDLGNETVDSSNREAIEGNEDLTTELPDAPQLPDAPETPELPETPETPEAPETPELNENNPDDYNQGVDDYNDKVDDYNEKAEDYNETVGDYNDAAGDYNNSVEDYNGQVDDYNEAVGEYNDRVDEINKELEDQYEEDHRQWEDDKQANEQAQSDYQTALDNYTAAEDAFKKAEKAYKDAYDQWKIDYAAWEERKAAYEAEHGTPEEYEQLKKDYAIAYAAWETECSRLKEDFTARETEYKKYLEELKKYEDYQDELEDYEAKKEVYDQLVTENEIYDVVQDYNEGVRQDNASIEGLNKELTSDLDTGAVGNLELAESNANVNKKLEETPEGKAILETLSQDNRDKLANAEKDLKDRAAALDAEANNKYTLGSEAYADYLERVKQFNADVEQHNANLAAYNQAVAAYNRYVDEFNEKNEPVQDSSTTDNGYSSGTADWGNITVTGTDRYGNETVNKMDHIDVKYQAASSKTVTSDGKNPVYSENVSGYTVTGVYANENTSYLSVSYDKNGAASGGAGIQTLNPDNGNAEFGGPHGGRIGFDPLNGTISFHVTLKGADKQDYSINVTLDDTTTFAEGSYYEAESTDLLKYYKVDGKPLKTVTIGNKEYYDISGQSVFVISALTCEGSTYNHFTDTINISSMSGLDLVLNLQTMIKVHQADNAQKLIYQGGYQLGKLAYAEKPADPGEAPTPPNVVNPPAKEVPDPGTLSLPGAPTLKEYTPFGEEAPGAPDKDYLELDPGTFDTPPVDPFNDPEPQLVQLSKLNTLEKLNSLDEMDTLDYLENKLDYKMILVIPEVPPVDPDPIIIDNGGDDTPTGVKTNLEKTVKIVDEKVPLAKAPKTGDLSGIWAVISGLSLGGITLLNRKRKEEE